MDASVLRIQHLRPSLRLLAGTDSRIGKRAGKLSQPPAKMPTTSNATPECAKRDARVAALVYEAKGRFATSLAQSSDACHPSAAQAEERRLA